MATDKAEERKARAEERKREKARSEAKKREERNRNCEAQQGKDTDVSNNDTECPNKTQCKDDQGQEVEIAKMTDNTINNTQTSPSEESDATQQATNNDQTKDPKKRQTRLTNLLNYNKNRSTGPNIVV